MSGAREIITAGNPATDEDMQRLADAAANADSLAAEAILPFAAATDGASNGKAVIPLWDEYQANSPTFVPGQLVQPSASPASSTVVVYPLRVSISKSAGVAQGYVEELFSVHAPDRIFSGHVPSNALGSTRKDLLYAVVQRGASVSAPRRVKSTVDGTVSTQTVTLETVPQITLVIATGSTSAYPALPADTGTAWNVRLALLNTPNGYTSGSAYLQANIIQIWPRGWIPQDRKQGLKPGTLFYAVGGPLGQPDAPIKATAGDVSVASRWGRKIDVWQLVLHSAASATLIVIDNSIDWRYRKARIGLLIPKDQGGHTYPDPTATGGTAISVAGALVSMDSGMVYTGNSSTMWDAAFDPGDGGGTRHAIFSCDASGLYVQLNFAKINGSNATFYIEISATDQFVL